jgi:phage gpG-like protein
MVGIRATVVGLKELNANFASMAESFSGPLRAEIAYVGAQVIAGYVKDAIVMAGLVESGALKDSVNAIKVNQWSAGVEVTAIYAAVHEFGLEKQPITDRQRGFFWAMFKETQDEKWRRLALSSTYTFPKRPYVRPGVEDGKGEALAAMADFVYTEIGKYRIK